MKTSSLNSHSSNLHNRDPKVAIVHDWLIGGGAERVVEALHQMYPEAPIYTSFSTEQWRKKLNGKVITGYLQYWPFSKLRKYIPFLRGWWFQSLKLDNFDLVISSSGAEAKFIKTKAKHIAYIHAPTHYYWSRYDEYLRHPGFEPFDWLARIGLKLLIGPMRAWDYRAVQRPDILIANSTHTQAKIKEYYGRESKVIHPPVDVEGFAKYASKSRKGFVITGRQTPYKRVDLAVAACTKLGLPLTVIGNGPEHKKLVAMAGPTVKFVTNAKDEDVARIVGSSEAFIFPGVDDFGISAVEALAAGTPVIAYKAGGALDYVIENQTGLFFTDQTDESLASSLTEFQLASPKLEVFKKYTKKFSIEIFTAKVSDVNRQS
ncbi:MAG: glycosyltransferase [Patescibacteria group bacterium]